MSEKVDYSSLLSAREKNILKAIDRNGRFTDETKKKAEQTIKNKAMARHKAQSEQPEEPEEQLPKTPVFKKVVKRATPKAPTKSVPPKVKKAPTRKTVKKPIELDDEEPIETVEAEFEYDDEEATSAGHLPSPKKPLNSREITRLRSLVERL